MDHTSTPLWTIELASFVEWSHHTIAIIMTPGACPLSGCFILISLSKADQKFGAILLSPGRWWHRQLLFFLHPTLTIFCNLTCGEGWNTEVFIFVWPWVSSHGLWIKKSTLSHFMCWEEEYCMWLWIKGIKVVGEDTCVGHWH